MNENTKEYASMRIAGLLILFFLCLTGCREVKQSEPAAEGPVEVHEQQAEDEGQAAKTQADTQGGEQAKVKQPAPGPDHGKGPAKREATTEMETPTANDRIQRGRRR